MTFALVSNTPLDRSVSSLLSTYRGYTIGSYRITIEFTLFWFQLGKYLYSNSRTSNVIERAVVANSSRIYIETCDKLTMPYLNEGVFPIALLDVLPYS